MDKIIPQKRILYKIRPIKLNKITLNSLFVLALLFLITINFISYNEIKNLTKAYKMVSHTYQVIGNIDEALYFLSDLEADQRGYLVTNDDNYLREMNATQNSLANNLEQLANLTQDNPEQNNRVKQFTALVQERLTILKQVANIKFNDKLQTPQGLGQVNRGNEVSNLVKSLGREFKAVEIVLLKERNRTLLEGANSSSTLSLVGGTFSIIFLIIPFVLANFELINRQIIEYKIRNTKAHLRQIIESTNEMIAAVDEKHRFQVFNEAYQREFKALFGKSLEVGMTTEQAFSAIPPEKQEVLAIWKNSFEPDLGTQTLEIKHQGKHYIYELNAKQIINENKENRGLVHTVRNISERIKKHKELQEAYAKLSSGMTELQAKNEQITLLVDMSDIMLASGSSEELSTVMAKFAKQLLSFANGYLFIMHPSRNFLEKANEWGSPNEQDTTFSPESCWALRLGRSYEIKSSGKELICEHVHNKDADNSTLICVPLMARNDIYGLLYLEIPNEHAISEDGRLVITGFAELTALALANVRLRENLRHQSIRDPLTGLYNRRYLEDSLFKQKHQAERGKRSFAVLMFDLDHFKKINDTFGHDAGDTVLKEIGEILQHSVRAGDIASRYGGEEFVLMLHDSDLSGAKVRAKRIRLAIAKLHIKYGAQAIGPITVSIGIAVYPSDAKEIEGLIELADKALYAAKKRGRNRVVAISENGSKEIEKEL